MSMLQIDFLIALLPTASLPLVYHAALKWLSYFNLGKLLKKSQTKYLTLFYRHDSKPE